MVDLRTGIKNNSLLTFANNSCQRSVILVPSKFKSVLTGTSFNLSIDIKTSPLNGTGNSVKINADSEVTVKKKALVAKITGYSNNGTKALNKFNEVDFISEFLTLNASDSYDPDNTTASNVGFSWQCPSIIPNNSSPSNTLSCQSLISGNKKHILQINAYQRLLIGFKFNEDYNFTLTAYSTNNPYKTSVSTVLTVTFLPPQLYDEKDNVDMKPSCGETMSINATNYNAPDYATNKFYPVIKQSSQYDKVIIFDKLNASQAYFYVSYAFNKTSSTCKKGQVSDQLMLYYNYNHMNKNDDFPAIIQQQSLTNNKNFSYFQSVRVNSSLFQIDQMELEKYYTSSIYWLAMRQNDSSNAYMLVDSIYFYRQKAQLVSQTTSSFVKLDKYDTLVLDASNSYDLENIGTSFLYIWTCPSNKSATSPSQCSSSSKLPTLTLTYYNRQNALINLANQNYTYKIAIQDPTTVTGTRRTSNTTNIDVVFLEKSDYSNCIDISINSDSMIGYSESQNRTVYVEYEQELQSVISMIAKPLCLSVNFSSSDWSIPNNDPNYSREFWTNFYMGYDSYKTFSASTYINVQIVKPDLQPIITSPQINSFRPDNGNSITLYGNFSKDILNLPYTCSWDCPTYFGGQNCSSVCNLTLVRDNLIKYTSPQPVSYYYEQSHLFTLKIQSSDNRQASKSQYLFLGDSNVYPFNSSIINRCGFYQNAEEKPGPISSEILLENWNQLQSISFGCVDFMTSANSLLDSDNFQLINKIKLGQNTNTIQISGLNNIDQYISVGDRLYLKPYSLASYQLKSNNYISIYLTLNSQIKNPLQQDYMVDLNKVNFGTLYITPEGSQKSYVTKFDLYFQGFRSLQNTGLLFQMRGLNSLYKGYQILVSLKPFSIDTLKTFYQDISIPSLQNLYFDFFDMSFKFIGSYDVFNGGSQKVSLSQGTFSQTDFINAFYPITKKTIKNYPYNGQGLDQIEIDYKLLQEYSECLQLSLVSSVTDQTVKNFTTNILSYLINNNWQQIQYFNQSILSQDKFGIESVRQIKIRTLLMLWNLIDVSTDIKTIFKDVIALFQNTTADLDSLINNSENFELLIQPSLDILDNLNYLTGSLNAKTNNISLFKTQISNLQIQVLQIALKKIERGQVFSYKLGSTTKIQYNFPSSLSQASFAMINMTRDKSQNQLEMVSLLNESYFLIKNADKLDIQFNIQTNATAPSPTILSIMANDSKNNQISFKDSDGPVIATFQLSTQKSYLQMFKQSYLNTSLPSYFAPFCVYFDEEKKFWSTQGIQFISYDYSSGIIKCSTSHFSFFTMDYKVIQRGSSEDDNYHNNTNIDNNNDNNIEENEPDKNNSQENNQTIQNSTHSEVKLFQDNSFAYLWTVIIVVLVVFISEIVAVKISYSQVKGTKIPIDSSNEPYLSIFPVIKTAFYLFHYFFYFCGMSFNKFDYYTLPMVYRVVNIWTTFFFIFMISERMIINDEEFNYGSIVGGIYIMVVLLLRPIGSFIQHRAFYFNSNKNQQNNLQNFQNQKISQLKQDGSSPDMQKKDFQVFQNSPGSEKTLYHQDQKEDLQIHLEEIQIISFNDNFNEEKTKQPEQNQKASIYEKQESSIIIEMDLEENESFNAEQSMDMGHTNFEKVLKQQNISPSKGQNIHANTPDDKNEGFHGPHEIEEEIKEDFDSHNMKPSNKDSYKMKRGNSVDQNGMNSEITILTNEGIDLHQNSRRLSKASFSLIKGGLGENNLNIKDKLKDNDDITKHEHSTDQHSQMKDSERQTIIESKGTTVPAQNNLKFFRFTWIQALTLLISFALQVIFMALTLIMMKDLGDKTEVIRWAVVSLFIFLLIILITDFVFILLFALLYLKLNQDSVILKICEYFLIGQISSSHTNAISFRLQSK